MGRIKHLVVIYLENHSFDNLYGEFPGANGLVNAGDRASQIDPLTNAPFATLPTPPGGAFPSTLPNAPFSIEQYIPASANTPDLVHRFYQEQLQIDGGKMDRYAAVSDAKGLVMGYYQTANLPLAKEAADNVLCDNFFHRPSAAPSSTTSISSPRRPPCSRTRPRRSAPSLMGAAGS